VPYGGMLLSFKFKLNGLDMWQQGINEEVNISILKINLGHWMHVPFLW
jgi:hypothetical protein